MISPQVKRSLIIGGLGHLFPLYHAYVHNFLQLEQVQDKYLLLADGFFVPAVVLLGIGVLTWLSSTGQFAGLKYATYVMFERFRPGKGEKPLSYPEFLEKYQPARKGNLMHLFAPGLYFLLLSFIFNALFGF